MSSSTSTTDAREERITHPIDVVEGVNKEMVQIVYDHLPEDVKRNIPISNPTEAVMDRIEQIKQKMRERLENSKKLDVPTSSTLDSEDETETRNFKEYKAQSTKVPGSFPGRSVFKNAVTGFTKRQKGKAFRTCPKKPHNASESDIVLIGNDCDVTESDDVDELCFDSMEKSRVEQIFEDKQKKYSQEISHRLAEINRLGIELENFGKCKQPILDTTAKLQKQARTICGCTHSLEMEITRIKYEVGGIIPISPSDNLTCGDFCIKGIIDKVIELQQKVEKIRSRAALKSAFLSMCNASRCRISRQNKGLKKDIQKAIQIVKEYEVEFKTIRSSIVKGVCKKPVVKNQRVTTGFSGKANKETDTKESDYEDDEDEGAAGYQNMGNQQNEWNGSTFNRDDQDESDQHESQQFQRGSHDEYSAANDFELHSYDDFGTDFSENETRYRGGKERSQTKTQSKSSTNDGSEESIQNGMPEEKQIVASNAVEANSSQAKMVCFTITTSSSHKSSKSLSASQARSVDSRDYTDENNSDIDARPQGNATGQTTSGRRSLNYTRNNIQTQRVSRTRETYMEISEAESAHRIFVDQVKHVDGSKFRQSRNFPTSMTSKAEQNRAYVVKPYSPRRPSPRTTISPQNENVDCRYNKSVSNRWSIDEKISGTERRASAERKNRSQVASSSNSPMRGKSGDSSTSKYKRTGKIEIPTCRCPGSSPGKRCPCPNCKCAEYNQANMRSSVNQSPRKPKTSPGRCCDCANCICVNQTVSKAQQKTNIQQKMKESKKRVCMCPGSSPGKRCPCSDCTCGDRGSIKTYDNGVDASLEHSQTSLRRWQRRRDSGRKKSGLCICSPRRGACNCAGCKCKPTPEIYADEFDELDDDILGKPGRDLPRIEDEFSRNRRKSPAFFEDNILGKRRRDPSIHDRTSDTRRNNSPSSDVTGVKSVSQQSIVISGSEKSVSSECKCHSTDDCSSSECAHNKSNAKNKIGVAEDTRKSAKTSKGRDYERSRSATRSKSSHRKDSCRFSSICRCPPDKKKSLGHISSSRSVNTSKSTDKSSTDFTGIYRGGSSAIPQNPANVRSTESSSNENSSSNIKDYYTSQFGSSSKSDERVKEESAKQFESKEHQSSWSSSLSQSLHGNKSNKSSSFCTCPPDEERCIIGESISNSTNTSRALSEYGSGQTSPRRRNRSKELPKVPSENSTRIPIGSSLKRKSSVNGTMSSARSSSLVDNFAESSSYCKCSSTGRSENYVCTKRKYDSESRLGSNSGINRRNTISETITKNVTDWSKTTDSSHVTIEKNLTSREDYFRSSNGKPIKSSIGYSNKNSTSFSVCECKSSECLTAKSSHQSRQSSKRMSATSDIGHKVSLSGKNSTSFEKDLLEKRESDVRKRVSAGSSYCHCHSSGKAPCSECVCDDLQLIPEEMESQKSLKTGSKRFSSDRKSIFGDTVWPAKDPSIGKIHKSLSICKCRSSGDKPCPECTCNRKRDKHEISLSQGSIENIETIKSFTSTKKSDLSSNFSRFSTEKVIDSFHHFHGKDDSEKSTTITIDKTFIEEGSKGKTSTSVESRKYQRSYPSVAKIQDAASKEKLDRKQPAEEFIERRSSTSAHQKINTPVESGIYQSSQSSIAKIRDGGSGEKLYREQPPEEYIEKRSSISEMFDSKQRIVTIDTEPLIPATKVPSKEQSGEPGFKPAKKPEVSGDIVPESSQEPNKTVPTDTTVVPSNIPSEKPVTSPSVVPSKQPEPDKITRESISKVPIREPSSQSKPKVDGIFTEDINEKPGKFSTNDNQNYPEKFPAPDKEKSRAKSSHEKIPSRHSSQNIFEPAEDKPKKVKTPETTSVTGGSIPVLPDKSVTEGKQTDDSMRKKPDKSEHEIVPSKRPSKTIEEIVPTTDPNITQTGLPPTIPEVKESDKQREIVPSKKPSKHFEARLPSTDPNVAQTGLPPTIPEVKESDKQRETVPSKKPSKHFEAVVPSTDPNITQTGLPPIMPEVKESDKQREAIPSKKPSKHFEAIVPSTDPNITQTVLPPSIPEMKESDKQRETVPSKKPSKHFEAIVPSTDPNIAQTGLPPSIPEVKETGKQRETVPSKKLSKHFEAVVPSTDPNTAQTGLPPTIPEMKESDKQREAIPSKKPSKHFEAIVPSTDPNIAQTGLPPTIPELKEREKQRETVPSKKPSKHFEAVVPSTDPNIIQTGLPPTLPEMKETDKQRETVPSKKPGKHFEAIVPSNDPNIAQTGLPPTIPAVKESDKQPGISSAHLKDEKPGTIPSKNIDAGFPSTVPDNTQKRSPSTTQEAKVSDKFPAEHPKHLKDEKPGKIKSRDVVLPPAVGGGKVASPEKPKPGDFGTEMNPPSNGVPTQPSLNKVPKDMPGKLQSKEEIPRKPASQDKIPGLDDRKEIERPQSVMVPGKEPSRYSIKPPDKMPYVDKLRSEEKFGNKIPASPLAPEQSKTPNKLQGDVGQESSGKPGQLIGKQPSKQYKPDTKQPGHTADFPGGVSKQPSQHIDKKNEPKDIPAKSPAKLDASMHSLSSSRKRNEGDNIIDPNAGKYISRKSSQNINGKPEPKMPASKLVPATPGKDVTTPNAAKKGNETEPLVDRSKHEISTDKPAFVHPEKDVVPSVESPRLPQPDIKQSIPKITTTTPAAKQPLNVVPPVESPRIPQPDIKQSIPKITTTTPPPQQPLNVVPPVENPRLPQSDIKQSIPKITNTTPAAKQPLNVVPPVESSRIPQPDIKQSIPKITTTPAAKQPLNVVPPVESPRIPQPDIKQSIPKIPTTTPAPKQPNKSDQFTSKTPQSPLPNQTLPQPSKPSGGINHADPIIPNQTMPNNAAKPPQATLPKQEAKQPGKVPANVYDPLISDTNGIRDQLKTCQENLLKYETENTKLLYEGKMADSERQKMLNDINQLKKKYDECLVDNVSNKTTAQQMLSLQTENSDLKKELNNMKVLLEQLQRRNDAQIDNTKKGLNEIPKYSEKSPNASLDCLQYIQKITFLETQLATLTRQNESNLKEFSECKANLDKCQDDLSKCYKELSKDPPDIAREIVKPISPADCQEWIDLAKKYEAQLKEYQVNTVRSSFMAKMIDRERNELKNERDELKVALQKCQDDLKKCLAEQKGPPLQTQVDLLINELQKLKALNEKQELAKAELIRQREEALKDVSKAQEKLQQYELEIQMVATGSDSHIGEQYAKMRSENNRLIAELDEKKREIDKLLASLESYRTRWNECKSKLERYGQQLDSKSYTQLLEPITQNKEPKESEIRPKPTVENNLADGDRHKVQGSDSKVDMTKCPTAAEQANLQNQIRQHRKDVREMQKLYENLQCIIQKVIHKLNYRPCCENIQDELAKIFHALNCMKKRICSCSYDEQEIEFNPQCIRGEDPVVHRICLQVVISGIRSLNFKQLIYLHCTVYRIGTNFGKTNCSRFPCEQFRCLSSNSLCNKDEGTEKEKIVKAKKISFEKLKLLECEMDRTKKLLKNFKKCCN